MRRLRSLRRLAGLNQSELAQATGIPQQRLSELETGRRPLDHAKLGRIARACAEAQKRLDPALVAFADGEIAAADPSILLAEARLIVRGIDEALELINASIDTDEIDVLVAFSNVGFARLDQLRKALAPLLQVPS